MWAFHPHLSSEDAGCWKCLKTEIIMRMGPWDAYIWYGRKYDWCVEKYSHPILYAVFIKSFIYGQIMIQNTCFKQHNEDMWWDAACGIPQGHFQVSMGKAMLHCCTSVDMCVLFLFGSLHPYLYLPYRILSFFPWQFHMATVRITIII